MVINNKIAFVPIPKNASWSVENTCMNLNLDLKYSNLLWENEMKKNGMQNKHIHTTIQALINTFGTELEYVCILRNPTDRFISAWKFFITQSSEFLDYNSVNNLKNTTNDFIINFIKNNYSDFSNMYGDNSIPKKLFVKLINELEFPEEFKKNDKIVTRFSLHMLTFISQYHWILNDVVKVKEFHFNDMAKFENYISEMLNVDFKLVHANETKLDYCSIEKNAELMEFVDRYIEGAIKKTKSIL